MTAIHPMFVHFPIAFYFLEFVLLVLWRVKKDETYRRFAAFTFWMGFFFMFVAAASGLYDAGGPSGIHRKVKTHFIAAVVLLIFYAVRALYWRLGKKDAPSYASLQIAAAAIGYLVVILTGFLGGRIVYG